MSDKVFWHSQPTISSVDVEFVTKQLTGKQIACGITTRAFENEVARYAGVRYALSTVNGTYAIYLALKILDCKKGDEIIMPSYVCFNVARAVMKAGCKPVLCDVGENWVMDVTNVKKIVTPHTKAIIAVNAMGIFCDLSEIKKLNIPVIEDACQNFGGVYKEKKAGTHGIIGIYSFHAVKCLTTGEGGMLVSDDEQIGERMESIKKDKSKYLSLNDLQSSLGLSQLSHYHTFLLKRKSLADKYFELLPSEWTAAFKKISDRSMFFRFLIKTDQLQFPATKSFLEKKKIHIRKGIDELIHRQLGIEDKYFINSVKNFDETISLPIYPALSFKDVEYICQNIINYARKR